MVICDECGVYPGPPKKVALEYVDVTWTSDNRRIRVPVYHDCSLKHKEIAPGIWRGRKLTMPSNYFTVDPDARFNWVAKNTGRALFEPEK